MNLDAIKQQIDEALFALTSGLDQPSYREVLEWLRAKLDADLMGMDLPSADEAD